MAAGARPAESAKAAAGYLIHSGIRRQRYIDWAQELHIRKLLNRRQALEMCWGLGVDPPSTRFSESTTLSRGSDGSVERLEAALWWSEHGYTVSVPAPRLIMSDN